MALACWRRSAPRIGDQALLDDRTPAELFQLSDADLCDFVVECAGQYTAHSEDELVSFDAPRSWEELKVHLRPTDSHVDRYKQAFQDVRQGLTGVKVGWRSPSCSCDGHTCTVKRVLVAGSVAHCTAVADLSDIDMVVILSPFNVNHYPSHLRAVKRAVRQTFDDISESRLGRLNFKFRSRGLALDVVVGADGLSDYPQCFLRAEADPGLRERLRTSCTQQAVDVSKKFAQEHPSFNATVRNAVHWVWTKEHALPWAKGSKPNSTLLRLLVAHALSPDASNSATAPSSLRESFIAFLEVGINYNDLCAIWPINYDKSHVPRALAAGRRPLVVCPVDPCNNVADTVTDWANFKLHAEHTLVQMRSSAPAAMAVAGGAPLAGFEPSVDGPMTADDDSVTAASAPVVVSLGDVGVVPPGYTGSLATANRPSPQSIRHQPSHLQRPAGSSSLD